MLLNANVEAYIQASCHICFKECNDLVVCWDRMTQNKSPILDIYPPWGFKPQKLAETHTFSVIGNPLGNSNSPFKHNEATKWSLVTTHFFEWKEPAFSGKLYSAPQPIPCIKINPNGCFVIIASHTGYMCGNKADRNALSNPKMGYSAAL